MVWTRAARLLAVFVTAAAIPAAAVIPAKAAAASAAPATRWLIKGQDLLPRGSVPYHSVGLAAQARHDEVTLPPVAYQLCGTWNGTIYGRSDHTTCAAGNSVLVVEDYFKFSQAITDGLFTSLGIHRAIYDLESWTLTPKAQSANPVHWIGQAVTLANANGIVLIVSTGGTLYKCSSCWAAAARDGAYMVAIQSQGWGWVNKAWSLPAWKSGVAAAVQVVHRASMAAGTKTLVMLGLGTNTPVVHPVTLLVGEYDYARSISVTNIWLNANNWFGRNRCNRSEGGYGCPEIGVKFLERIGAAGTSRAANPGRRACGTAGAANSPAQCRVPAAQEKASQQQQSIRNRIYWRE